MISRSWHKPLPAGEPLAGFTPRARKAFQLANQEAHRRGDSQIGTEHLVLGLVKAGAGQAFQVLQPFGFDLVTVRDEVARLATEEPPSGTLGSLPSRADIQRAIDLALEKARELHHDRVGTGHLLLALLSLPDTKGNFLLGQVTSRLEELRLETLAILTRSDSAAAEFNVHLRRPNLSWLFAQGMGLDRQSTAEIAAIRELQARFLAAERAADWDTLVMLCTEDAVWAPPNESALQGRPAIHDWGSAPQCSQLELSETLTAIALCGSTAYVHGTYELKSPEESADKRLDASGTFLRVLRKQGDGAWLVAFDTWSSDHGKVG